MSLGEQCEAQSLFLTSRTVEESLVSLAPSSFQSFTVFGMND